MIVEERDFRNVTIDRNRMHISGKATQYNAEGNRNFTIVFNPDTLIDGETMDDLIARNWPIRVVERDGVVTGYLKVIINYAQPVSFEMYMRQPAFKNGQRVTITDADGATHELYHVKEVDLDQEESKMIDGLNISHVDLTLNLATYNNKNGYGSGYCVYLKDMSFVKEMSHFAYDYNKVDVRTVRPDLADELDSVPFNIE